MISQLLAGNPLPIYGDGRNIRDWLHVLDHCRGIDAILAKGQNGETYNVGGQSECENIYLVRLLCSVIDEHLTSSTELRLRFPQSAIAQRTHNRDLIRYVSDRPRHERRYAIDSSKIEHECDFEPRITLGAGLRATVAWCLGRAGSQSANGQRAY